MHAAICCALVLAACGCGQGWTVLRQPGSGFVVTMPDSVTCRSVRDDTVVGQFGGHACSATLHHSYHERFSSTIFEVSWASIPAGLNADQIAAELRKLATGGRAEAFKTVERSATLDGFPAVEYDTVGPLGRGFDAPFTVRIRAGVHQGRLYQVWVTGLLAPTSERAWKRMLDSFHFVATEEPAP